MPSRIIREGILTSERVDLLSEPAEVFYRRLMSVVDDFGRFHAKPSLLRSYCYPLRTHKVDEEQISQHLAECVASGLILIYGQSSKQYLQLIDFKQQVRAKESKYPGPPAELPSTCVASAQHMQSNAHLDVVEVGDVVEVEVEVVSVVGDESDSARKRIARKKPLPADFKISPAVDAWAADKGHSRLVERLEDFIGKAKAKGYTYIDWDQAFMNAIRNDWAGFNGRGSGSTNQKGQKHETKRDVLDELTGRSAAGGAHSGRTYEHKS